MGLFYLLSSFYHFNSIFFFILRGAWLRGKVHSPISRQSDNQLFFLINYLRSDGVHGKVFAPRPLVTRVMSEIEPGMSPYFVPMDKETKGTRSFNRLVFFLSISLPLSLSLSLTHLFTHSFTLTYSLTYSLTHSFTYSLTLSLSPSLFLSHSHSL